MQCISKEDGNIVLLHQGKIGNKLRRLFKLELFFYKKKKKKHNKKQMSSPLRNQKIKTSLNEITNRNNAHFFK